jgi:hypothetical protein
VVAEIDKALATSKRSSLVYLDPSARVSLSRMDNCRVQVLVLQSLTGVGLVRGIPPASTGCQRFPYYAVSGEEWDRRENPVTDEALCDRALKFGIEDVLILRRVDGAMKSTVIACASQPSG